MCVRILGIVWLIERAFPYVHAVREPIFCHGGFASTLGMRSTPKHPNEAEEVVSIIRRDNIDSHDLISPLCVLSLHRLQSESE